MNRRLTSTASIRLSSHPESSAEPTALNWGSGSLIDRGPIVGTLTPQRNAIGAHTGSYSIYRALAIATGTLDPVHVPDLTDTAPAEKIGPHQQWFSSELIVSLDPFGHEVSESWAKHLGDGWDIRPTIAITKAHLQMPELETAVSRGRLKVDGDVLTESIEARVTKVAIEPVWYLPGIAERFQIKESELRRALYEQSGGMFTELVTRNDLKVFLPPIGGMTVYLFGDLAALTDPNRKVACRVHDECNGSDVFGSDICTCRPYLAHGVEVCIETAQNGGCGVVVYNRKEGRALGEVTKFLVYNARKRQPGGDRAETYFERTECIAGVQDMRFQELMPDVIHWLGIKRIDQFVSMSNMKFEALERQGVSIAERVALPDELIPDDASVEMDAKKAAGYFTVEAPPEEALKVPKGRGLDE